VPSYLPPAPQQPIVHAQNALEVHNFLYLGNMFAILFHSSFVSIITIVSVLTEKSIHVNFNKKRAYYALACSMMTDFRKTEWGNPRPILWWQGSRDKVGIGIILGRFRDRCLVDVAWGGNRITESAATATVAHEAHARQSKVERRNAAIPQERKYSCGVKRPLPCQGYSCLRFYVYKGKRVEDEVFAQGEGWQVLCHRRFSRRRGCAQRSSEGGGRATCRGGYCRTRPGSGAEACLPACVGTPCFLCCT
jgi:hypothetical protein